MQTKSISPLRLLALLAPTQGRAHPYRRSAGIRRHCLEFLSGGDPRTASPQEARGSVSPAAIGLGVCVPGAAQCAGVHPRRGAENTQPRFFRRVQLRWRWQLRPRGQQRRAICTGAPKLAAGCATGERGFLARSRVSRPPVLSVASRPSWRRV